MSIRVLTDTMLCSLPVVEVDALNSRDINMVLVLVVLPLHLGQAYPPLPLVLHEFQVQQLVIILLGAFGMFWGIRIYILWTHFQSIKVYYRKKDDLVYSLFCTWEQRVCLSLCMDQSMGCGTSLLLLLVQLCSITIPDHQLCMVNRVSSCCRAPSVAPTFSQTYI